MGNSYPLRFRAIPIIASLLTSSYALPTHSSRSTSNNSILPSNSTASSIEWSACPPEAGFPENLQCANFSVPINWEAPDGEHFDLGLVKLPATSNTTSKIGSLFVNPGGPGGSAVTLVVRWAEAFAEGSLQDAAPLFENFDFIGLDPRGVGLSHPVQCDMNIYSERVSLFPKTQEEYDSLVDHNKRLGESCQELTGPLLEHIDTISVVKDHEAVRIALGNEPINFFGLSYGTQIGAQYAQLFPDNIRVLALDGMLQHSQAESTQIFVETSSYQLTLTHFFDWASENETSPLKGEDVKTLWLDLIANATEKPIPAPDCNGTLCREDVTGEEILFNAQGFLLNPHVWINFASALYNATQGDASAFSVQYDPSVFPGTAIACLDWTYDGSKTLAGVQSKKHMAETFAPLTQGASQIWTIQHSCLGWPAPVNNPPKELDVKTEQTVLTVNADGDPSTGYPWAVGLREEIENKAFVTRKGDGHTSFSRFPDTTKIIVDYLVSGKAPKDGVVTSN